MTEEPITKDGNICQKPTFKVELTIYEWHKLLKQLEFIRSICNRDQEDTIDLWEQISTQLSSTNQVIYGSKKHRQIAPEEFKPPVLEVPTVPPVGEAYKDPPSKSFWEYFGFKKHKGKV